MRFPRVDQRASALVRLADGFAPASVRLLGTGGTLAATAVGADVHVTLPAPQPASAAYVLALAR